MYKLQTTKKHAVCYLNNARIVSKTLQSTACHCMRSVQVSINHTAARHALENARNAVITIAIHYDTTTI